MDLQSVWRWFSSVGYVNLEETCTSTQESYWHGVRNQLLSLVIDSGMATLNMCRLILLQIWVQNLLSDWLWAPLLSNPLE